MKTDVFHHALPFAKQREIADYFVARLRSVEVADYPCFDYPSACALARVLQKADKERLIQTINIHGSYVRIQRNSKGSFAFAAVVLDHVSTSLRISGG